MNIIALRIMQKIAPAYARARAFDYWLQLLNQQTALELRGMKGGIEWSNISRDINRLACLGFFAPKEIQKRKRKGDCQ